MKYTTKCHITIFLSMVLVMIMSLVFAITELTRIQCMKLNLQIATNASIDSLLSLYNRKLYQYYKIFGVDIKDDLLLNEYKEFIYPYIYEDDNFLKGWYSGKLLDENISLQYEKLIDDTNMSDEIYSFMKYALLKRMIKIFDKQIYVDDESDLSKFSTEINDIKKKWDENAVYEKIDNRYFDFDDIIKKMANAANDLKNSVYDVNDYIKKNKNVSISASENNIKSLKNNINALKTKFDILKTKSYQFKDSFDVFNDKVIENENKFEDDLSRNKYNYNESTIKFIRDEFSTFKEFVDENNDMNKKVDELLKEIKEEEDSINVFNTELSSLKEKIEYQKEYIKDLNKENEKDMDAIKEAKDELKEYEEEIKDIAIEYREYLSDLIFTKPDINLSNEYNKKNESLIKSITKFSNDTILKLVMDEEEIKKLKEDKKFFDKYDVKSSPNLVNKGLLTLYTLDNFNYYNKNDFNNKLNNNLEVERIITSNILKDKNNKTDKEVMKDIILEIFAIRMALNMCFVYTDYEIKSKIRPFISATIGTLSPIISETIFILVLTALATGQTIVDIKKMLKGKKVQFFHNRDTFIFSTDDLINLATGNLIIDTDTDDSDSGLVYKDYLMILLFAKHSDIVCSNLSSIINDNIQTVDANFDLNNVAVSFKVENQFNCPLLFTNLLLVETDVKAIDNFKVKIGAYGNYLN